MTDPIGHKRWKLAPRLIMIATVSFVFAKGQTGPTPTLADLVVHMNHPGVRSLLAQPGGLAQAANKVGHLVLDCRTDLPSSMDLVGLVSNSSAIALCQVRDKSATVDPTTNLVTTRVHCRADEVISGKAARDFYVNIPGGGVAIGTQSFANVRFDESKAMDSGEELVLFLTNTSDNGVFKLTNGIDSIFFLSLSNGLVTSAAKGVGGNHAVSSTSTSLAALRNQILAFKASSHE